MLGINPRRLTKCWLIAAYSYEINGKVFVVKTAGGEYAKLRFTDMSDATGKNEAATFDYEFPLK